MTGFLNVLKPEGMGSTYVVNRCKRLTHTPCGHLGTLDPLACGVLPVGVGNATRLFDYFLNKQKHYVARFVFGATTDTLDREGEIVREGHVPTEEAIAAALPSLTGEYDQIPPLFSAKSVGGRRGYELARKGEQFSLPPKRVLVASFTLIGQTAPDEFAFDIVCGGGTYIRSLARDLAERLGTKGYMSYLRRTASGVFTEETGVPFEELTPETVERYLIPTDSVLPFPKLEGGDERIFHGVKVPVSQPDGTYKLYAPDGTFYGLASVTNGLAHAEKKLC